MKKLLVNGCSFTAGSWQHIDDRSNWSIGTNIRVYVDPRALSYVPRISPIVWSRHLEDKFENVYNLGKGGKGNDRIVRTTLDYCNNNDMTDYVAIIQWTSPFRTEYWNPEDNEWVNVVINNGLRGNWTLDIPSEPNTKRKKLQTLAYDNEMKWLNSFNDYDIAYYNNVLVLQNFFENKQIPYMFTSMSDLDHPFRKRKIYETMPTTTELNLKKLIDKSKWTKESLSSYNMDNYISQEDRHPNLKGNKLIAQALFKELMEKYGR